MVQQDDDDEVTRLRLALARIAKLVDRQVTAGNLTRTQMSVLAAVVRRGRIGATELADLEGLNPTMLSRVIGKLESEGLLRRVAHPDDRRAVLVEPTPAGQRVQRRLRQERRALFAERLDLLPEAIGADLIAALPALEALADAMRLPGRESPAPTASATEASR
jgi:DNA-binding MarR family transcriptional regulator